MDDMDSYLTVGSSSVSFDYTTVSWFLLEEFIDELVVDDKEM